MSGPIVITVYPVGYSGGGELFDAKNGDRLLVRRSRQPLLHACRVLLGEGADPGAVVEMRHEGSDAYLKSTISAAAVLTIKDSRVGKPVFAAYRPYPLSAPVTPPLRQTEVAGTHLLGGGMSVAVAAPAEPEFLGLTSEECAVDCTVERCRWHARRM